MINDRRGVSDVLAFTLIFGVMITSVGLMSVVGFDAIAGVNEHDQLSSAEGAMTELADQMTGIADHEAPVRSTELRLRGAEVSLIDGPTVRLNVSVTDGPAWNETVDLGGVTYQLGDSEIAVVGGSVIRIDGDHAVVLRDPPFMHIEDRSRLNLLSVRELRSGAADTAVTSVQIRSHHRHTRLVLPENRTRLTDAEHVGLSIEGDGPIADAWERYLERSDAWVWDDEFTEYRLTEFEDGVVIRMTRIGVQFIR